jgi:hypothetical protein
MISHGRRLVIQEIWLAEQAGYISEMFVHVVERLTTFPYAQVFALMGMLERV